METSPRDIAFNYESLSSHYFALACHYRKLLKVEQDLELFSKESIDELIEQYEQYSISLKDVADKYQNMLY